MAKAKDNKAQTMTKKDFILQQEKDLPAKEVVAKGADQGIELTEKHVHVVRSAAKATRKGKTAKSKGKAKRAKAPAAKAKGRAQAKAPSAEKAKGISKSDFIRKLPASLSAKEVVAKAAAQGIEFTEKYVYVIRSAAKARTSKAAKAAKPSPAREGAVAGRKAVTRGEGGEEKLQTLLRQAIADCGLVRSREIFSEVESAFSGG